jgi:hypothetical protein
MGGQARSKCAGQGQMFIFRITHGGQRTAEDAARINVNSPVQPFGFGNGCVTIDQRSISAIFCRPVVAHLRNVIVHIK